MKLSDHWKELDPTGERRENLKKDLPFQVSQMVVDARFHFGLTQTKLAKMVGTKQPSIARLERGVGNPKLSFLKKIADALDTHIIIKFAFIDEKKKLKKMHVKLSRERKFSAGRSFAIRPQLFHESPKPIIQHVKSPARHAVMSTKKGSSRPR